LRILITGGNGFIGSHLADALVEAGYRVGLADLQFSRNTVHLDCGKFVADVRSAESLLDIVRAADLVMHFAAISRVEVGEERPEECIRSNLLGTFNIARLCAEYGKTLVYSSSREVYGEPLRIPVIEGDPKRPISTYGVSKLGGEGLIEVLSRTRGLTYVIVRFSNVYGSPRDLPERVTPKFMRLAMEGKPLPINGGDQVLDFNFIDDVITGLKGLVEAVGSGALRNDDYNLASGKGVSIVDLAKLVKEICRSDSELIFKSKRSYDVSRFIGDGSKSRSIGYEPKHDLREGLRIYRARIESQS